MEVHQSGSGINLTEDDFSNFTHICKIFLLEKMAQNDCKKIELSNCID
jgi:hypothetical protein